MSERVMEGAWNPGGGGTSTNGEVWPLPVECLMNGMLPIASPDGHLALFGNSMVLPPQFRHRFPHPGIHFPVPGQLGGLHHGPLSLMSIPPQHSMVESSDPSSLIGPGGEPSSGQDAHPQPLDLNNHHHHALEDSEEGSEEDEDEDDVSEEEMNDQGFVHSHEQQQQVSMSTMSHASLTVNEDSLPSCQHSQQQTSVINGDPLQSNLISGMDESCHQKNLLPNGLSHRHQHEEEIPAMSHAHPLNSNPISAIPMITGNPLLLSDSPEDEFSENVAAPSQNENDSMDGDPNSGHSVHGKMYVEGRVVFHLKQWTDSGFGSFNSCREQDQQKSQLNRCAVCRLKSPNGQDNLYSNQQKDAHRHPVKGVLFTFEDCIIVELYPEQLPGISCNSHHPLDPKQNVIDSDKTSHPMPISSYLNPSVEAHNHNSVQMESIVVSSISLDKPTAASGVIEQPPEDDTQGQSWWDEFDSQRAEAEEDSNSGQTGDIHQSSCIMNLKLEAQSMQHTYQQQHSENQEKPLEHDGDSNNGISEYHFKWKCDRCAIGFLSSDHFEAHRCLSDLNVPEPEPVDPEFTHNEIAPTNNSLLPDETTELNERLEIVETIDEEMDTDVKPKATVRKDEQRTQETKSLAKYPCPVCKKAFNLKKLLKQHLEEQHESGNPFRCNQCKTQYADEKRLKRHSCTLSVTSLKNRQSKQQSQGDGTINVANVVSEGDIDSNERHGSDSFENKDKTAPASDVDTKERKEIPDRQQLKKKAEKNDGQEKGLKKKKLKSIKSKESENTSRRPRTNIRSAFSSLDEEDISEDELDEDYDYETQTRLLSSNPKEIKDQSENPNRSKKGFKCNICGKSFTVERRLINHKASHKTDRSSQCEKCGKKFARKDKLMRHMYVHSEEKMFVCEICEKRFSRRDKLTDHLKSHGTDEIHNCPMCQKQFLRPDILKQHVKLHQMGNKHQCPECLRFVTGKDRLTKHMARHEEAKALGQTLLCPLCTKYFIQRQSLKAHIKKFHPDALVQLESEGGKFDGSPDSPGSSNDSSEDNIREPEVLSKGHRTNVTTVCLLIEDVMGTSKTVSNKPKPFSCENCSQTFVRKQALRKHMLLKHFSSEDNGQGITLNGKIMKRNQEEEVIEEDEEIEESQEDGEYLIQNGKSEESNPSSLSSLSTSSSPPIQLMSMSSVLQQQQLQEHHAQMTNSQLSLNQQELNSCSSITGELGSSDQSHLPIIHTSGSLHQMLPQQAHISAYSHHLLATMSSMVTSNGNSSNLASTIQQSLESGGDTDLSHAQQLGHSSTGLGLSMNHHSVMGMGSQPGNVMCPSSSYVLSYPPYHYQ